MKRWIKVILLIVCVIVLSIVVDLICIFMWHKPLLAIKGVASYSYKGLFYDTYYCPDSSIPQLKLKGRKFECAVNSTVVNVEKIVDKTKYIDDFVCAEMLEEFYNDQQYRYYFSCMKKDYVIVQYDDGSFEPVSDALNKKIIKISDLDLYDIDYIRYNRNDLETFTKTYRVLNMADSNDYNYLYLTLRMFQGEEVATIKVKRDLAQDVVTDMYYEFTFNVVNKNIADSITSIFENAELISIVETDKEGLAQIQDPIR